jgi:hypothetical protein
MILNLVAMSFAELALSLSREIDIRGFAGCGRILANTQAIEPEPAASLKPPPDQYQQLTVPPIRTKV